MNLRLFIKSDYFKPIEKCNIKIRHVSLNNILLKTVHHWKIDVFNSEFCESQFRLRWLAWLI